jgi:hypothetical protein
LKRKTLLISLILILCILAGCSNNGGSEQQSSEPLSSSENAGKTISGTVVEVSLFNNSFVFDTIDSEKIQVKVSNSTEIDFLKKEEELPSESVSENTSSTETQNKEETINQGNVEVSIDNQAQGTEPSEAVSAQSQTETTSTGSQGNNATSDQSQKPSIRDIKEGDEVELLYDNLKPCNSVLADGSEAVSAKNALKVDLCMFIGFIILALIVFIKLGLR